ncbi:MAG: hypothetical protein LBE80_01360, partial [Deltaproteobacteria bacterium]|nr:hypothetical protein [Deltaproteobacteria bacterium]
MDALTHISCPNCGGDVEIKPGLLSLTCPYCDSQIPLVTPKDEPNLIIDFLIPVGVSQTDLTSLAHSLMIAPETAPDDILEKSQVEESTFYYVPCYQGEGKFDCSWSATFGFDRQEPYTDYVTRTDSKGRTRSEPVTRYRTVTDWRPASGTGAARFSRLICAADSKQLPQAVSDLLQEVIPFQPIVFNQALMGGLAGLDFAYSPEQGQSALSRRVQDKDGKDFAYKRAQGDHQRDWAIDSVVTFDGPVKAGYLPVGKFVFSYGGKNYTIWAEGTKLSHNLKDDMPIDYDRKRKISFGYRPFQFSLLAAAVSVGLAMFAVSSRFNWNPLMWTAAITLGVSLIYALIRSSAISRYSKGLREASLAAKQLELSDATNPKSDQERRALLEKSQPKPRGFFARTDGDKPLILTMLFLFVIAIAISFLIGLGSSVASRSPRSETINQKSPDSSTSSSWESSQEAAPSSSWESSPEAAPSSSWESSPDSSTSSSLLQEPSSFSSQRDYLGIPPGPKAPEQVVTNPGPFNFSELNCTGNRPDYCTTSGRAVNGVVYALTGAGNGARLDYLAKYTDGLLNGPKIFYDPDGDM